MYAYLMFINGACVHFMESTFSSEYYGFSEVHLLITVRKYN